MGKQVIYVEPERLKPLIHGNKVFKSADDFSVTEEDLQKAHKELGETEEVRIASLQKLKEKIRGDTAVKYNTDDSYLLRYLRYAKFDVERAYQLLQNFYKFRQDHPDVFDLSNLENILNSGILRYLPYTDEDHCLVFYMDWRKWNIDKWALWDILSVYHAISDIVTLNPNVQIRGVKGFWDLRGLSLRHIAQIFNVKTAMLVVQILQEIYPYRAKKIVCFHGNKFIRTTYAALKHVIKKKMRDRVVLIGSNISEIHEYYNPAVLPKEYGGNLEDVRFSITRHIMDNLKFLEQEREFGPISKN